MALISVANVEAVWNHYFYTLTVKVNRYQGSEDPKRTKQKHYKISSYNSDTLFKLFWSHVIALCEEKTEFM